MLATCKKKRREWATVETPCVPEDGRRRDVGAGQGVGGTIATGFRSGGKSSKTRTDGVDDFGEDLCRVVVGHERLVIYILETVSVLCYFNFTDIRIQIIVNFIRVYREY